MSDDTITPLTQEDGQSKDLVKENVEKLKKLFPEIVTDGKIDFETLKEELGEFRETSDERYSFTWNGKSKARKLAMEPSRGTLRPAPDESVNWNSTENLFIEGDNLEVLKLLQRGYHKKVKIVYIDPPYNTGNDFVYSDDYKDNLSNYLKVTGQLNGEGNKISSNPDYSGRYHTDWLNMMYPRLKLARELLKVDGVMFISVDDNEQTNLKKICDEIFGEENFIANLVVRSNPRGSQSKSQAAIVHEYVLAFAKDISKFEKLGLPLSKRMREKYKYSDENGDYRLLGLRQRGGAWKREQRPSLFYPFFVNPTDKTVSLKKDQDHNVEVYPIKPSTGEDGSWRWSKAKVKDNPSQIICKRVQRDGEEVWDIYQKDYLTSDKETKLKTLILDKKVNYQEGTKEVKSLFNGKDYFDFPKPVFLIKKLITAALSDSGEIIMDFFAGSSTTAHAVMEDNVTNDSDNKFIMVQLPELLESSTRAQKDGYKNIADIGKERIKRSADKIKEENPEYEGDLGFKVFKLDSSNIKPWDPTFEDVQFSIEDSIENVKSDRNEFDLLYEILLKYGIDLSLPIEEHTIDSANVYIGGAGALVLCPSDNITLDVVEGIAKIKEEYEPEIMRVVFRDNGFKDDVVKTNAIQILKQHEIEDVKSI